MNLNYKSFCLIIGLLLLCSCNYRNNKEKEISTEIEKINTRHAYETKLVPEINIKDYTSWRNPTLIGFTTEELNSLTNYKIYGHDTNPLKYEEAVEDVELAFKIFKNCYAPYNYFGGNEVFEEAKKQVLYDCQKSGDNLKVGVLHDSLMNNLEFVKDGHFFINDTVTFKKAKYYSNNEESFFKDEEGYYILNKGRKLYVSSVAEDKEVSNYMKRSVDDEGRLIYRLGVLSYEKLEVLEVDFHDRKEKFYLTPPDAFRFSMKMNFTNQNIDNIPVIALRSFSDKKAAKQFIDTAEIFKNSPVSILDIRGNHGGPAIFTPKWLDVYAPELSKYYLGNMWAVQYTRANIYLNSFRYKADFPEKDEKLAKQYQELYKVYGNRWDIEELPTIEQVESNNILFVLVDNRTSSSAEALMALLKNMKNVIFVGTNSNGCMMGDSGIKIVLPNSKIHITCSSGIRFFFDETVFTEEKGFEPDIWVSKDALKSVLNMISYYNLK